MKGVTVDLIRFVPTDDIDQMGEPVKVRKTEQVDNVLWHPTSGEGGGVSQMTRENSAVEQITIHLPKAYTKSVAGCLFVIDGQEFAVQGDPVGYMPENTPGDWNRPVYATRVEG